MIERGFPAIAQVAFVPEQTEFIYDYAAKIAKLWLMGKVTQNQQKMSFKVTQFKFLDNQASPVDFLLSDLIMPVTGGVELAHFLSSLYPNMTTIFMSGYAASPSDREYMKNHEVPFLAKPFSNRINLAHSHSRVSALSIISE